MLWPPASHIWNWWMKSIYFKEKILQQLPYLSHSLSFHHLWVYEIPFEFASFDLYDDDCVLAEELKILWKFKIVHWDCNKIMKFISEEINSISWYWCCWLLTHSFKIVILSSFSYRRTWYCLRLRSICERGRERSCGRIKKTYFSSSEITSSHTGAKCVTSFMLTSFFFFISDHHRFRRTLTHFFFAYITKKSKNEREICVVVVARCYGCRSYSMYAKS